MDFKISITFLDLIFLVILYAFVMSVYLMFIALFKYLMINAFHNHIVIPYWKLRILFSRLFLAIKLLQTITQIYLSYSKQLLFPESISLSGKHFQNWAKLFIVRCQDRYIKPLKDIESSIFCLGFLSPDRRVVITRYIERNVGSCWYCSLDVNIAKSKTEYV